MNDVLVQTVYETAYKPHCSVTYSEHCDTIYVTDYKLDYKEKCYTAYQSVCEKTYRQVYIIQSFLTATALS